MFKIWSWNVFPMDVVPLALHLQHIEVFKAVYMERL